MIEPYFSIILAFLAALSWGINAHLVRSGMKDENQFIGLFIRSIFTFPILFGILLIWKGFKGITLYFENPHILILIVTSSVLIIIGDGLFLMALKKYTVNLMAPITAVYPIFTTTILIITGTEHIGTLIIVGTMFIISGVAIVTSGDISGTYEHHALLLGIIISACWGTSIYFVRLALEYNGTDSLGVTGARMLFIGIGGLVIFMSNSEYRNQRRERTRKSKMSSMWYMAASGIVGWVIGASLFFFAVQNIGAGIPTPISSTNPIIASIIGSIFGIEQLSRKQFSGIMTVVLGIILIVI